MAYVNSNLITTPFLHVVPGLGSAAFTFSFWVKALSYGTGGLQTTAVYALVGTPPSPTNGLGCEDGSGTNKIAAGNVVAGPENDTAAAANFHGWQYIACVCTAAGVWTVYSGLETASPTVLTSGTGMGTVTDLYISDPFTGVGKQDSKFNAIKFWNTNLSAAQIATEFRQQVPALTTNLQYYLSCNNGTTIGANQQGSGGNWTQTNSGFTTDTDTPSVFSNTVDNSLMFGSGTTG